MEFDALATFEEGIKLVRRASGGSTVYQDPGNLNFSFICHKEDFDLEKNFPITLSAFATALTIP